MIVSYVTAFRLCRREFGYLKLVSVWLLIVEMKQRYCQFNAIAGFAIHWRGALPIVRGATDDQFLITVVMSADV